MIDPERLALMLSEKDFRIAELESVLAGFADINWAAITPSGEPQSWEYMASLLASVAAKSREALEKLRATK